MNLKKNHNIFLRSVYDQSFGNKLWNSGIYFLQYFEWMSIQVSNSWRFHKLIDVVSKAQIYESKFLMGVIEKVAEFHKKKNNLLEKIRKNDRWLIKKFENY